MAFSVYSALSAVKRNRGNALVIGLMGHHQRVFEAKRYAKSLRKALNAFCEVFEGATACDWG